MIRIKFGDSSYPESLKNISDPPIALYCLGKIDLEGKNIGIVGSRQVSNSGKENTYNLTKDLVNAGFIIVSGLAVGVDATAHLSAIENGGTTIAVLGAGVDIIYPPENKPLYNSILKSGGSIISEVPSGKTVPLERFAARNRIISGLSLAIVVPEAQLKSGSMITVRLALEQGKDVYVMPGSPGTDYLIEQGAQGITSAYELLEDLA